MPEVFCEECGQAFNAKPYRLETRRARWCSMKCRRIGKPKDIPLRDRFESKFSRELSHECWLWTGAKDSRYGRIQINGVTAYAHRVAYELANGSISNDLSVLHKCDTPLCVNPAHLFLGTIADNSADMVAKNRQARGEKNGGAKLTAAEVIAIRNEYYQTQIRQHQLANKYGMSQTAISQICLGKTWRHIPAERIA